MIDSLRKPNSEEKKKKGKKKNKKISIYLPPDDVDDMGLQGVLDLCPGDIMRKQSSCYSL
jgi:hypothetical protein